MKKVYLVHGSEDGVIGIYSNVKRAYERAIQYGDNEASDERKVDSYAKTCKALKELGFASVVESSYAESNIEMFNLNQ
tara:strand:+ start:172 stop:405 length:234 start_codon:yes stop_codon:yes gene_type:complete